MQRRTFLTLAALLILSAPAAADKLFTGKLQGVALAGYDAVSYFNASGPAMGSDSVMTEWKGAKWYFSSAENLAAFQANPEKYAPQYGGYCAYAASKGALAPGDPEAWTVHDNKLYVNLSKTVRETWSEDIPGNIVKADANWPTLNQ
jgi:hypothetical protein